MTFELRQPLNFAYGTLTQAAALSDTTLVSADFASATKMATGLSTTQYVPVVLMDLANSLFEIVWVTGHTAASTSATVVRGKEGTTARAWPAGTQWQVAQTVRDGRFLVASRANLSSEPHIGMEQLIGDEQHVVKRYSWGWGEPRIVLPGGQNRITDDTDTTATTEKVVVTSGTYALEPNSFYMVRVAVYFLVRTSGDRFDVQLKETSTAGTQLGAVNGITTGANNVNQEAIIDYPVITGGSGASKVYVGTLQRNNGSGTAYAKIGSHVMVERLGHSSLHSTV